MIMDEIMSKIGALMDELNKKGMRFSLGQYAIVCKDAVVILNVTEEGLGVNLINNRLDINYELGVSKKAIEEFMFLEEVQELAK